MDNRDQFERVARHQEAKAKRLCLKSPHTRPAQTDGDFQGWLTEDGMNHSFAIQLNNIFSTVQKFYNEPSSIQDPGKQPMTRYLRLRMCLCDRSLYSRCAFKSDQNCKDLQQNLFSTCSSILHTLYSYFTHPLVLQVKNMIPKKHTKTVVDV